jgi:hypothetical protein
MDVTTSEILVFAAQRHQKPRPQFLSGSRMPIGRWKFISEDAQKTWDQLDDGDKAKILALNEKHMKRVINEHHQVASDTNDEDVDQTDNGPTSCEILAMVTQSKPNHPADIRKVLSQKKADEITVKGRKYRLANVHQIKYDVSAASRTEKRGALIDRGANGGIAGADTRVIARHPHRYVDIRDIDNHEITSIPIVTAGAVARTQRGNIVVIMHQYSMRTIRSKAKPCIHLVNWNLSRMTSTINQSGYLVDYTESRLLMDMYFLLAFVKGYLTYQCAHTQTTNMNHCHMSCLPAMSTGTLKYLIMTLMMMNNGTMLFPTWTTLTVIYLMYMEIIMDASRSIKL